MFLPQVFLHSVFEYALYLIENVFPEYTSELK